MAILIGGIEPYPGKNNHIVGTDDRDVIFGDPFTTGVNFVPEVPQIGGALSSGRGGNDYLNGAMGDDSLFGDAWHMSGNTRGGNDRLKGAEGNDDLTGDAQMMDGDVRGGNDRLKGGAGDDTLIGDGDTMSDNARGATDKLEGGTGSDFLFGDAFSMDGHARGANDTLNGEEGDDYLVGDAFLMRENARGSDDTLTGGPGLDIFYFAGDFGDDTVTDAETAVLGDIVFGEPLTFVDYASRQADFEVTQRGDDTIISIDDNSVTLLGVTDLDISHGHVSRNDWIFNAG